jgi:hypothetical protein
MLAFGASVLCSQNAFSVQERRNLQQALRPLPPAVERVADEKKRRISSRWKKGRCSLVGPNSIVYDDGKNRRTLTVSVPVYVDREKPMDMSCSSKRTVVLTNRKIVTVPGYDLVKDADASTSTSMSQHLGKPAKLGVISGEIEGNDIFVITANRQLWHTDLNDPVKITGYNLGVLTPGKKRMEVHRNVLFIVQNAPARGNFLIAVVMGQNEITTKEFGYVHPSKGKLRITEQGTHLELRIGEDVHLVKVGEKGKLGSVSLTPGS